MNQKKAYLYAALSILLWSTVGTAFKIGLSYLNYIQLLFYSSLSSFIVLSAILLIQAKFKQAFIINRKEMVRSSLISLLNPLAYYLILFKAYSLLPAQLAQPLNYTWPVVMALLAVPLLKQKLMLRNILALFISLTGVLIISTKGDLRIQIDEPVGVLLASSSSLVWALYWILNLRDKRDETIKLFWNFLFGTIYTGIFALAYTKLEIKSIQALLSSVYIGLFEMGITFFCWMMALKYAKNTTSVGNLVYLSPFISLIFIHFILKEKIFASTVCGLVLIIAGILVQQSTKNKEIEKQQNHTRH